MHISAITVSFNGGLKKYTVDYLKLTFVNGANLTESYVCSFQVCGYRLELNPLKFT